MGGGEHPNTVGATYDELIERKTGKSYVSGAGTAPEDRQNQDYGYLAAFRGSSGNHFLIVAGNRDIGVMQTAEIATDSRALARLNPTPDGRLEALYEVDGVGRTNLGATAVAASR